MVDFLRIATRSIKKGIIEVYPKFIVRKSSDLMIRGGDFYAIWLEDRGLWSTDEDDVITLVDHELELYVKENKHKFDDIILVKYMWDSESGVIDTWHKYCQRQMRDNYYTLNENLLFSNQDSNKELYSSKRLNYPLQEGDYSAWSELTSVLYSQEELHKIEWAIGSVVNGASKTLEKFLVFYGAPGTGKSTILKVIQKLFDGYYSVFDSKALGSATDSFALESFRTNPLVAIQHDGDLSRIEDNTRLNSLTSHEIMIVNEKHKSTYEMKFISFLFMGTNKPVKITDSKSGLIRRLIDVRPTGDRIPVYKYNKLMSAIKKELGAIAWHCKEVFEEDPQYYDDYKPTLMMGESNDFYNFILDSYTVFCSEDGTTLKSAWEMYKAYCEDANVLYPFSRRQFKSELLNYFKNFDERVRVGEDYVRSYYSGFRKEMFDSEPPKKPIVKNNPEPEKISKIIFKEQKSYLDEHCKDCPAQYGSLNEFPRQKWSDVKTCLKDLDTSKLHYVKLNELNHIVIDFDLKGPDGKKDFERNVKEASKWPKTYAELSKSGQGIHLHYFYDGDVKTLNRLYSEDIEVKVYTGNSSLRRKLTKCNNETINHLPDILPKRKEKPMVGFDTIKNEKALRTLIINNLNKEYHSATKPSIDFIYKNLEDAYNSGMKYDVSDLYNAILAFAIGSTNQSDYCVKLVDKMHFKSDDPSEGTKITIDGSDNAPIIFLDVEVFPNLFLVNWKKEGDKNKVVRMINPSPREIETLLKYRIIGYNCRRYDNHMLYARLMGYSNEELYELSQKIIVSKSKINNGFFQEAYNISYTDIYDYAKKKQSLKKWEIELGIHHQELGLPWDKPVPESMWHLVAEYCDNDVISTEAVWNATQEDFKAREILVKLANLLCPSYNSTVNDTTNQLTGRIIFRGDKNPQSQFLYTDLKTGKRSDGYIDPCHFPDYEYSYGKSTCNGDEIGEGGYVDATPGMYVNVKTFDVASMHPHSALAMMIFGETYTKNFQDLINLRMYIKHADWDKGKHAFGGILSDLIEETKESGSASQLAGALKIAINSVYGLTSAHFPNLFKDPRNVDNIVAKRGALFMYHLKKEVQALGGKVVHIKTDSIKVSDPSPEIEKYILDRGKEFGYTFEVESIYERFCLVNDAVYIAKCSNDASNGKDAGKWTATGAQFQVPYVFKKCFSHEPIEFSDLCETKEVKSTLFLDMNEGIDNTMESTYLKLKDIRKKDGDLTKSEQKLVDTYSDINDDMLAEKLASYHKLQFIGRIGLFSPMKKGLGGGILVRESKKRDGTTGYDSVTGTKGYRWLESEEVIKEHKEDGVDLDYYDNLVNQAIDTISTFGDYEWFVNVND